MKSLIVRWALKTDVTNELLICADLWSTIVIYRGKTGENPHVLIKNLYLFFAHIASYFAAEMLSASR